MHLDQHLTDIELVCVATRKPFIAARLGKTTSTENIYTRDEQLQRFNHNDDDASSEMLSDGRLSTAIRLPHGGVDIRASVHPQDQTPNLVPTRERGLIIGNRRELVLPRDFPYG